jgi:hypothetical protein
MKKSVKDIVLVECHGFEEHVIGILIIITAAIPICCGLLCGWKIKIIIKS